MTTEINEYFAQGNVIDCFDSEGCYVGTKFYLHQPEPLIIPERLEYYDAEYLKKYGIAARDFPEGEEEQSVTNEDIIDSIANQVLQYDYDLLRHSPF